jgi:hypothetical protein
MAAGAGEDETPLTAEEKTRWRKQAVDWLKADLSHWSGQPKSVATQAAVVRTLTHWKRDSDLAGIRHDAAIRGLSEDEQRACRALWAEVDQLLDTAR